MSTTETDQLSDAVFERLAAEALRLTGIALDPGRKAMVQGRLRPRLRALGLSTYSGYLKLLKDSSDEVAMFVDLMTTNKTLFYRTPRIWQYLAGEFLPKWLEKNPKKTFRAWSAAASSGQEAYTLGIFCEAFRTRHPGFEYQILGTDISRKVLRMADEAVYAEDCLTGFIAEHPQLVAEYLQRGPDGYTVDSRIRSRVRFMTHNLVTERRRERFDLVLVRNVLIYFQPDVQQVVIDQLTSTLNLGATLIIGESESISRLKLTVQYKSPLIYEMP